MTYTKAQNAAIENLRRKHHRITKIRKSIINIFLTDDKPLSASDISTKLLTRDIFANKTTIYREIDFLKRNSFLKEIDFGDGKKRFEKSNTKHHHHLVCVNCGSVKDIELEVNLEKNFGKIEKASGFKIKEHSLELFGVCKICQY